MHNIGLSTSFKSFPKKFLAIGQKRCSKDAQKSQKLLFVTKVAQKKLLINFVLNLNQKNVLCVLLKLPLSFKYCLAPASAATL